MEDWGVAGRKQRIFTLYRQGLSNAEVAEHLRSEYNKRGYAPEERAHEGPCVLADGGEGYGYFVAAEWRLRRRNVDGPMRYIKYEEMAAHIRTLIDEGRYLTPEELAQATITANQEQVPPSHVPEAASPAPAPAIAEDTASLAQRSAVSITQDDIDAQLRFEKPLTKINLNIYAIYQQNLSVADTVEAIKSVFGRAASSYTFPDGTAGWTEYDPDVGITLKHTTADKEVETVTITWPDAEKRLRQLISEGRYLTPGNWHRPL